MLEHMDPMAHGSGCMGKGGRDSLNVCVRIHLFATISSDISSIYSDIL